MKDSDEELGLDVFELAFEYFKDVPSTMYRVVYRCGRDRKTTVTRYYKSLEDCKEQDRDGFDLLRIDCFTRSSVDE